MSIIWLRNLLQQPQSLITNRPFDPKYEKTREGTEELFCLTIIGELLIIRKKNSISIPLKHKVKVI